MDEYTEFLKRLLKDDSLDDAAADITRQVIEKGEESLSSSQKHIFKKEVIDIYTVKECILCSNKIAWAEMLHAIDNGGLCCRCVYAMSKD